MQERQKDIWAACTGVGPKEIEIVSTGRQTGKSVFNQIVQQWNDMLERQRQPVKTIDREIVDGDVWYLVDVHKEVAEWIRTQDSKSWYQHKSLNHAFDVSSRLYTMLNLKW